MSRKPLRLPSFASEISSISTSAETTQPKKLPKFYKYLTENSPKLPESVSQFGMQAKLSFLDSYKNRIKKQDRNRFLRRTDSPPSAYLEEIDRKNLSPRSLGIVFPKGKSQSLDMTNCLIGNNYARAVSRGIRLMRGIRELNLTANRLSDVGIFPMLDSADFRQLTALNLSNNQLGMKGIASLAQKVSDPDCQLASLILENTRISNRSMAVLSKAMANNLRINWLNLARNRISDVFQLVASNSAIKKLDLHWNHLQGESVFLALAENDKIKEIDLSWNSLGKRSALSAIENFLNNNDCLTHIDLSYNNFTKHECTEIASFANDSEKSRGFHMIGNYAYVNEQGQIVPTETMTKLKQSQKFSRIFKNPTNSRSYCWVCKQTQGKINNSNSSTVKEGNNRTA